MIDHLHRQRGAALITVMLVFLVCSVIAGIIFTRQQITIHRTNNMLAQVQAYEYDRGAEAMARNILLDAGAMATVDYRGQPWSQLHSNIPVTGGTLAFQIEDLQGRFNLNTLYNHNDTQLARFEALLELLGLPKTLAPAIAYRVGNKSSPHLLWRVSQLREVEGVTPEIYAALLPYIATLPETESFLNVNTASDIVLNAYFFGGDDFNRMKEALVRRGFITQPELNAIGMNTKGTGTRSKYFLLKADAKVNGRSATLTSTLYRTIDDAGRVQVALLWRDRNEYFAKAV
jgi:general secretion pathway protein K